MIDPKSFATMAEIALNAAEKLKAQRPHDRRNARKYADCRAALRQVQSQRRPELRRAIEHLSTRIEKVLGSARGAR
jgi:hypothetical protein